MRARHLFVFCLAFATPAFAEDAAVDLEEAVVTVTRLPSSPADAPGLRLITADEIEAMQATFAADVLVTVPGVSLYREGAFGGVASLRLRGASTDKTLVLLDGVPLNDPASPAGAYDFSSLDLSEIDRIEVLSGPQSSLWGSNAIGGVIALTTREADGLTAAVEAGSYGTVYGRAAVGRSTADHAVSAFVSAFRTDGVSKADEADGNPEADGFESLTFGAAGRVRLAAAVELDGRVRFNQSDVDLDGFPAPAFVLADTDDRSESRSWSGFARARIDGPAGVRHSLSLSFYDLERESFGGFPGVFTAERQVWRWTAERDRAEDRLGLVGGVEHEAVRGDASFADARFETTSAFAVARLRPVEGLTATLGVRHDAPDDFDGETTFRATLAAELGGGFRATASWGEGFKTPTISQILCDFCFAPPVPLSPETAAGWDATLGWRAPDGRVQVSVTVFGLEVEDQIAYVAGTYVNIDRTTADGVEADVRAELGGGFSLKAGYAWTDAVDRSTGLRLLRAPEHAGSATLFWARGPFDAALTVRGESDQRDVIGFGSGVRDGFVVANLAMGWAVNAKVRLTARIENLADERYQEAAGYGEPGLSGYFGVRLRY